MEEDLEELADKLSRRVQIGLDQPETVLSKVSYYKLNIDPCTLYDALWFCYLLAFNIHII